MRSTIHIACLFVCWSCTSDSDTTVVEHRAPSAKLILHYSFDDATAADSSGNGRNGILVGNAAITPDGRTGSALTLDGNGSYLQLPDRITDALQATTVAAWVNIAEDRAWSRIFDFGGSVGFMYLASTMGNGQFRFSTFAGPGNEGTVIGPNLPLGVWKHIAVTSSGRDFRVYIDGVEAANQLTVAVAPADIGANTFGNWIGKSRFPDPFLAGRIDDFRIYDGVLAEDDIRALAAPQLDYLSYRFDDDHHTIAESSDAHDDGVLVAGRFGDGVYEGDVELRGGADRVVLPPGLVRACNELTASTWFRLDHDRPWSHILEFATNDRSSLMYLGPSAFGLVTPGGNVRLTSPVDVPAGEWNHLAVVLQGGTASLFFNGRMVQSQTGVTATPAQMGVTFRDTVGDSFDGGLDDIRIACRGYDPREIQQLAHLPLRTAPEHRALSGDIVNVHDPAIIAGKTGYYVFSTGPGLLVRTSPDLDSWTFAGSVFPSNPSWVVDRLGNLDSLWAPDVSWFAGTYHLYYAASTFGSNSSCIGHATKRDLASADPWVDHGPVICSNMDGSVDNWNAIDPHVIVDTHGVPWMSFGSFWGGIKMIRLSSSGARADTTIHDLATRPSTAIEASYIIYRAPYYYLFASFDFCCQGANSNYNLVVGRSTSVTGPYVDRTGLDMMAGGGTSVVVGDSRFAGPGSNAVLRTGNAWWNVYHTYDALAGGIPTLRISELLWRDGWPVPEEP